MSWSTPESLFLFFASSSISAYSFSRFFAAFFLSTRAALTLGFFSARGFSPAFFLEILHDQRNPAIRWILWRIRFAQTPIRKSPNLRHLVFPDSI